MSGKRAVTSGQATDRRAPVITRGRVVVAAAVAMLAAGVFIAIGGDSDDAQPTTPARVPGPPSDTGRDQEDPLALGRGATYPDAAASSAATKVAGGSALDTVGLPDVDPCSLLDGASVAAAIGPKWAIEPERATGTLQCRWASPGAARGGGEVHLTIGRDDLYKSVNAPGTERLSGLGEEAVGTMSASGGLIAVLTGDSTLVLALSTGREAGKADVTALAREALSKLPAASQKGNG